MTSEGTACKNWAGVTAGSTIGTERNDPLVGNHHFCRNPGGVKDNPWCYVVETNAEGSGLPMNWEYCSITARKTTCHSGKMEVQKGLRGNYYRRYNNMCKWNYVDSIFNHEQAKHRFGGYYIGFVFTIKCVTSRKVPINQIITYKMA